MSDKERTRMRQMKAARAILRRTFLGGKIDHEAEVTVRHVLYVKKDAYDVVTHADNALQNRSSELDGR